MIKLKNIYVLSAYLLVMLCGCSKENHYPSVGDPLPDFSLVLNNGMTLSHQDLSSSDFLMVFFHSKCPDCQRELPTIEEFHRLHPQKTVIAVSREESDGCISEYWIENELTLLYSAQEDRRIYEMFCYAGIPHTVISRKGIITAIFTDTDILTESILEEQFK